MDDARIAELLSPFLGEGHASAGEVAALSPAQLRDISIYVNVLMHWNARINLTAVREPEEIVTRHFGESIFAARHVCPGARAGGAWTPMPHVIDVGSGAGFPGLPIKIWDPQARLTLIESNQKKATFLREVVRRLRLTGVDVFAGRANAFTGSKANVVTLRAVECLESILPLAADLVEITGVLAMLLGGAQVRGVRQLLPAFQWDDPIRLPLSASRVLILGRKEP